MAKKLHLVHVKSSVADKAPSASTLDYGEIAVNYNSETPALYIRDDEDNIVKFIAEPYFNKIVGTGITENDGETITPLTEVIEQDELTVSAAFNDINNRLSDLSGVTAEILSDLNEKASTDYVDEAIAEALTGVTIDVDDHLDSASTNPVENRVLTRIINENEMVTAAAINYLNDNKVGISEFDDLADDLDELASGIAMNYYTKGETPITGTTQTGSGNVVTSVTINDKVLSIALGEISGGDEAVSAVTINGTGNSVTDASFIDKSLTLTKGNVQETLVSGTNIKTFAGQELLGAGEVVKTLHVGPYHGQIQIAFKGNTDNEFPVFSALVTIPDHNFAALIEADEDNAVVFDYGDGEKGWVDTLCKVTVDPVGWNGYGLEIAWPEPSMFESWSGDINITPLSGNLNLGRIAVARSAMYPIEAEYRQKVVRYEKADNKVVVITSASTDNQYPSAKAV